MRVFILLSLLFSPAYAEKYFMPCEYVREIAKVVIEDPYLSESKKETVLRNLVGRHGLSCISRDAND